MFRTQCCLRVLLRRLGLPIRFASSVHPNAPLELDPSLRALLQDVDMSLVHYQNHPRTPPRQLEALPAHQSLEEEVGWETSSEEDAMESDRKQRKSPAAQFGSQNFGAIVLPFELQKSISSIIASKLSGLETYAGTNSNIARF
jgi:hypothetical protein